jgi:hypothetical protein
VARFKHANTFALILTVDDVVVTTENVAHWMNG